MEDGSRKAPFPMRYDLFATRLPSLYVGMWTLPENDANDPIRWVAIKALFSKYDLQAGGREGNCSVARAGKERRSGYMAAEILGTLYS